MSQVDPRFHQALDGDIAREGVPPDVRRAMERLDAAAALLAVVPTGASVEARVMAAIRRPVPSRARRLVRWLATPHAIRLHVRPVWSLALAAIAALLMLFSAQDIEPVLGGQEGIAQFVGRFPGARSVHVVGSFNDWRAGTIPLEDRDHDGVWQGAVVLPVGAYEYMFVVDGERWVPDRLADRSVEDDFGRENSIVIVRGAER